MKSELEKLFKNKKLLEQALTHRSWVNEHKGVRNNNERLEFLGDAVLEFIVSNFIYDKFPEKEEGYLTALRAKIVNTTNLASVSEKLEIGQMIHLSKGEEASGGKTNKSLLADTIEAVIGALYLDQGIKICREFINKHILYDLEEKIKTPLKDPKSLLQEKIQEQGHKAPVYKVVKSKGPDHAKIFLVEVCVENKILASAEGSSKSEAAQKAADIALSNLGIK